MIVPQQIPEVSSHSTEDFPTAEDPYYTHTKPGSIEELTDAFGQATIGNSEPSTIKTSNEHTKSESFDSRRRHNTRSDIIRSNLKKATKYTEARTFDLVKYDH